MGKLRLGEVKDLLRWPPGGEEADLRTQEG
jgi:hypothetical protein